jgi:polysaccharide deacetylase family protein (PEP-CTERM system associated)
VNATPAFRRLVGSFCSLVGQAKAAGRPEDRLPRTSQLDDAHVIDGLSVDLEDYYQVEAFASRVSRSRWTSFPSRVRQNTIRTLELLESRKCKATFFVLGWVAKRDPGLIREVAQAGHELACHSYLHRPLYKLKPSQFRDDLRRSRDLIEDIGRTKVVGFRAPTFSITPKTLWALEILSAEGFRYDSSIFPIRHDLYGIPDAPRWAHRRPLPSGQTIWEIPPSTIRMGRTNVPFGGGGYLRLLPMSFTRWAIRKTHSREGQPVIVYFHPWELDPDQPRLAVSWRSRMRHYTGLNKTLGRLQEILSIGSFQTLGGMVRQLEGLSSDAALQAAYPYAPWRRDGLAAAAAAASGQAVTSQAVTSQAV